MISSVPSARAWDQVSEPVFPGSQPVSLARANIDKLKEERWAGICCGGGLGRALGPQ